MDSRIRDSYSVDNDLLNFDSFSDLNTQEFNERFVDNDLLNIRTRDSFSDLNTQEFNERFIDNDLLNFTHSVNTQEFNQQSADSCDTVDEQSTNNAEDEENLLSQLFKLLESSELLSNSGSKEDSLSKIEQLLNTAIRFNRLNEKNYEKRKKIIDLTGDYIKKYIETLKSEEDQASQANFLAKDQADFLAEDQADFLTEDQADF
ncbi:oxoc9 [Oxyplax ochracea nucleopolyhedrovirus]|uniref:Oxoc9 n=1 Tax=Oxyplax ochracea nucleopolyhedrovirus TaxID=2083176 RepID=A0A2L0WTY4_9ABAC|nr:oxoc9 [Oxyplax ochracea nucleopolyhedrovirus]AVA31108.1 oxoc9 [Oxyplax ochracea nucleopolyhedrovirus]